MSLFLTQLMNGIGSGAVYASLALALVLVFRTTGILNFAQGEMALYSTYLVWYFTQRGGAGLDRDRARDGDLVRRRRR